MKKNIWKQLKKQNDGRQLNLEVPDQKYIDKVTAYAINQGVGMMETPEKLKTGKRKSIIL